MAMSKFHGSNMQSQNDPRGFPRFLALWSTVEFLEVCFQWMMIKNYMEEIKQEGHVQNPCIYRHLIHGKNETTGSGERMVIIINGARTTGHP